MDLTNARQSIFAGTEELKSFRYRIHKLGEAQRIVIVFLL